MKRGVKSEPMMTNWFILRITIHIKYNLFIKLAHFHYEVLVFCFTLSAPAAASQSDILERLIIMMTHTIQTTHLGIFHGKGDLISNHSQLPPGYSFIPRIWRTTLGQSWRIFCDIWRWRLTRAEWIVLRLIWRESSTGERGKIRKIRRLILWNINI